MSSANIGWLFYKDYYRDLTYTDEKERNDVNCKKEKLTKDECLIAKKVQRIIESKVTLDDVEILGTTRFQATTSYPGLLLGSGNTHELPNIKGQAILGFHFDYTSGLPVIPGSSVKGVLRSAFEHKEYVSALTGMEVQEVEELEKDIFDNADIFYDAVIIKANSDERILGDDYITPHSDPLKDPKPLRFIKVLPDVTFLFQFELADGLLSKMEKEELFKKIISDLGLGAKTNVGYGKFIEIKKAPRTAEEEEQDKIEAQKRIQLERERHEAKLEEEREAKRREEEEKKVKKEQEEEKARQKEKEKTEALLNSGIESLIEGSNKFKTLASTIKTYMNAKALDEEEKDILESHLLNKMNDKKLRRRRDFPFGIFGDDKCFGKERANDIADKLNLA